MLSIPRLRLQVLSHVCNKFYRQTFLIWTVIRGRGDLVPRFSLLPIPTGRRENLGTRLGKRKGARITEIRVSYRYFTREQGREEYRRRERKGR